MQKEFGKRSILIVSYFTSQKYDKTQQKEKKKITNKNDGK